MSKNTNVARMLSFIGRTGNVVISGQQGIKFGVRVVDVRITYSVMQFMCEPISGSGFKWYAAASVELNSVDNTNVTPKENE